MESLRITKAKPNPLGKDVPSLNRTAQLGAEWIEITNDGPVQANLSGIQVRHTVFLKTVNFGYQSQVVSFTSGVLGPGQVVRVHSGPGPAEMLRAEDAVGADYHVFTHQAYVWNNKEGDNPTLLGANGSVIDMVRYFPNPPDGKVLVRVADLLL